MEGKSKKSGEKIFLDKAEEALSKIEDAARKIQIKGVAVIGYIPGEKAESWITRMKVVDTMTNSRQNMLGIAYTKAAEMADTHLDSGSKVRGILTGELGYQGGAIKKVHSGYILAVFSGGTSEQDLEVSKVGLEWLNEFFDK